MNNKSQPLYVRTEEQGYLRETDVWAITIFQINNNTNLGLRTKQWVSRGFYGRVFKIQGSTLNIYILRISCLTSLGNKQKTLTEIWHTFWALALQLTYIAPPTDQGLQIHQLKILERFGPHFFFSFSWSNWLHEKFYAKLNGCHLSLLLSSVHQNFSTLSNGLHVGNQPVEDLHVNLGSSTKQKYLKKADWKINGKTPGNRHHGGLPARGTREGGAELNTEYMDNLPGIADVSDCQNWRWIQHLFLPSKVFTRVKQERESKQDSEPEDHTQSKNQLYILSLSSH